MTKKKGLESIEFIFFLAISLVGVLMLAYFALNPYNEMTEYLKKEQARLSALNIAGSLSFLHSHPNAEYKYIIELKGCDIYLIPSAVIVKSEGRIGVAYMISSGNMNIAQTHIQCNAGKTTIKFFKREGVLHAEKLAESAG